MTDRYSKWNPRDSMRSEVIPLDTKGPKRLWGAPAGYVTRRRGTPTVTNVYVCPVHGAFEAKSDAASVACRTVVGSLCLTSLPPQYVDETCGLASPWSPSPFSAWQSSGMVRS